MEFEKIKQNMEKEKIGQNQIKLIRKHMKRKKEKPGQ